MQFTNSPTQGTRIDVDQTVRDINRVRQRRVQRSKQPNTLRLSVAVWVGMSVFHVAAAGFHRS